MCTSPIGSTTVSARWRCQRISSPRLPVAVQALVIVAITGKRQLLLCTFQRAWHLTHRVRLITSSVSFLTLFFAFPTFLGNIYIGDSSNNRVRKVTVSTGIITTIAGTGTGSYSGDNSAASSATIKYPHGLVVDASGTTSQLLSYCDVYLLVLRRQRVHHWPG
jgi:hypothetical protein